MTQLVPATQGRPLADPPTTPAAGTPPAETPAGLKVEGSVLLTIAEKPFLLRGTYGDGLNVQYHRSLDKAASLGHIDTIVGSVAGALGIADPAAFEKEVRDGIAKLNRIKGLGDRINAMSVVITDLGINTKAGVYEFGFGFRFDKPFAFDNIQLNAVGVKITYVKKKE